MADAESYCATRFASALSRAGHNVIVITMDWPMQISKENFDKLVDTNLEIIRLPFSKLKNTKLKGLLWYGHCSQMAVDVKASVKAVKQALLKNKNSILITRTHPVMSSMVGLKSYKYAWKWIAHFSDPIPWTHYGTTLGHKLLRRQEKNIISNSLKLCDFISLTCDNARKYYKDEYPKTYQDAKTIITTHIGDYRIDKPDKKEVPNNNIILHPGSLFKFRGGLDIMEAVKQLNNENYPVVFRQIGYVDSSMGNKVETIENIEIYDSTSLEENVKLTNDARVIFVPDFNSYKEYSPFLLSKFVYHLMNSKPIIAYSLKDSEMYRFSQEYPEAGIFWAEIGNIFSLKQAIKKAMECDIKEINRESLRYHFNEDRIVTDFISKISQTNLKDDQV